MAGEERDKAEAERRVPETPGRNDRDQTRTGQRGTSGFKVRKRRAGLMPPGDLPERGTTQPSHPPSLASILPRYQARPPPPNYKARISLGPLGPVPSSSGKEGRRENRKHVAQVAQVGGIPLRGEVVVVSPHRPPQHCSRGA